VSAARDAFAVVGLAAVLFLAFDAASLARAPSEEVQAHEVAVDLKGTAADVAPVAARPADPRQRALSRYVARTYRIATEAAEDVVLAASESARKLGLDPLLVLAVIAIESRFNPVAESDMGAKGLMQVIPKYHLDKLALHGGETAILDPWINVLVGAQILKEYVTRAGSLEAGLQWYNGSANDESRAYSEKVLAEKDRIAQATGHRVAPRAPVATPTATPQATGGGNQAEI
jgi:soluble lytic murein transglycosylase-like protein